MKCEIRARFALCVALFASSVIASPSYTALVVTGDSLSDVGNAFLASGGTIPDPHFYWNGRASNGPVWVEHLAELLNVAAQSPGALPGTSGSNFAFYGAQSTGPVSQSPPPMSVQLTLSLLAHAPAPTDLYVLWGGTDDAINGQLNPTIPANAIAAQVEALADAGARQFLIGDLPPLGKTPALRGTFFEAFADQWAVNFNATLHAALGGIQASYPDAQFHILPTFDLFAGILNNALAHPFVNVTDPAMDSPTANPDTFLFWDSGHPTRAAHRFLAERAYDILVPEPAGFSLLILAVFHVVFPRPRRHRAMGESCALERRWRWPPVSAVKRTCRRGEGD